jgi:hypothetical protein
VTHFSATRRTPINGTVIRFTIMLSLLSLFAGLATVPAQAVATPVTQAETSHTNDTLNLAHYTYLPLISQQTGPLNVRVTAKVDPPSSRDCQKSFLFTGTITTNGPATIRYQWDRSDGTSSPPGILQFASAGTHDVSYIWNVSDMTQGWAQLHVIEPQDRISETAYFILSCDKPRMAYIYNNDVASRDAFHQFFYNKEYQVDLVSQYAVTTNPNAGAWQTVVIGPDVRLAAGSAETQKLDSLSRPILGIGEGGRSFFQAIAMDIGTSGWQAPGREVVPVNPQDQFWRGIDTTASTVPLYTADSPLVAVYNPQAKVGFIRIGRQTPSSDTHHYPLVAQEKNGVCHKLWGFTSPPNLMTDQGKQLFTNMFLQTSCPPTITSVKLTIEDVYCSDSLEAAPPQGNGDEVYFRLGGSTANGYSNISSSTVQTGVMRGMSYKPTIQEIVFPDPGSQLQITVEGIEQDSAPEFNDGNNTLSGAAISLTRDELFHAFGATVYRDIDLMGPDTGVYKVRIAMSVE